MTDFGSSTQRGMVETHKGRDTRLQFFYLPIVLGITVLAIGLVFQQVIRSDEDRTALRKLLNDFQ